MSNSISSTFGNVSIASSCPDDVRSTASSSTAISNRSLESKMDTGLLCTICNSLLSNPRTLACLHVFDAGCLESRISHSGDTSTCPDSSLTSSKSKSKASDSPQHWIDCPVCEQRTSLFGVGSSSELVRRLPRDLAVLDNVILSACDRLKLKCTRCQLR